MLSYSKETAPADTVLLHGGYARCPNIVHPSPFVFKVELFMRINKIPYKVSTITDKIPVIQSSFPVIHMLIMLTFLYCFSFENKIISVTSISSQKIIIKVNY